jgi:hypothetical protein
MADRNKKILDTPMASSRLVSITENALQNGAVIGGVIYMDEDDRVGYQFTEEATPAQIAYMLRYAELRFMMGSLPVDGEDEDNYDD